VKVISVKTGEIMRILRGHTGAVTKVAICDTNAQRAYSASLDGTVRVWDFADGACLEVRRSDLPSHRIAGWRLGGAFRQVLEVGLAVCDLAQHPNLKNQILLTTCKAGTTDLTDPDLPKQVRSFDLRKKKHAFLHKAKGLTGLVMSHDGGLVCSLAGRSLLVWSLKRASLVKHTHRRAFTAIASHPREGCVATADCRWHHPLPSSVTPPDDPPLASGSGRIQLWYELDRSEGEPRTATMHWHAHAVPALAFSVDGTFLVSGGEEMVLVVWQLATGQQQFLPRLGQAPVYI
jgi:NET1-associated nuclear protein 1 (U3 small nucleolar RNA-associated protein 17)